MPVVGSTGSQNYPSLEGILNLIRSLANDAFAGSTNTPGEGQILTDFYPGTSNYNPQVLNCFNAAIREMYRKLRNVKAKALIRDNYDLENLPVVNGPLGQMTPDPTIQTYLTFAYYFDGLITYPSFTLPSDLLMPLRIWERQSNTTNIFTPLTEAKDGLYPGYQTDQLRQWEWREGRVNFNGATIQRDIRLKYLAFLPAFFPVNPTQATYFANTQIPVFDCEEVVAWGTLKNLSYGINPASYQICKAEHAEAIADLRNEEVRRMQATSYGRPAFDNGDPGNELNELGV